MTERVEILTARVTDEGATIRQMLAELRHQLEGPPRGDSIRGRLHVLENDTAAARAATAALEAARAVQAGAFTRKERIVVAVLALITTCTSIVGALAATGVIG